MSAKRLFGFLATALLWACGSAIPGPAPLPAEQPVPAEQPGSPRAVSPEEHAYWRQVLDWPEACGDTAYFPEGQYPAIVFTALDPDRYLARVTCSVGLYQPTQLLYVVDLGGEQPRASALDFPQIHAEEREDGSVTAGRYHSKRAIGHLDILPGSGGFTLLSLSRGAGGCGVLIRYRWQGERVEIESLRAKFACEREMEAPDQWPLIPAATWSTWPEIDDPN